MNKRIESNDGAMEAVACCGIDLQSVLPNFLHPLETTEYRKDQIGIVSLKSPQGKKRPARSASLGIQYPEKNSHQQEDNHDQHGLVR